MDELKKSPANRGNLTVPSELNFLAPLIVGELIRIGNLNDGGYVIPKRSILEVDTLVSLGVSTDWSFDEHFKRLNPRLQIHAYDHTISEKFFRRRVRRKILPFLLRKIPRNDFTERLRALRSYRTFFSGDVKHFAERIHNRADTPRDATLDRVFARTSSSKIFLKIDIEGSEYRIVDSILKYVDRIEGIVIEFHNTDPLREVFCKAVKKLQTKFDVVHVHGNNYEPVAEDNLPEVLEVTFAKTEAVRTGERRYLLPLPGLDNPNNPARPDYELQFSH